MNALSPAKVADVELNEEEKEATVHVDDDQFSLAIGRGGQNVRLAAKLTGWVINVEGDEEQSVSSDDDEKTIMEKTLAADEQESQEQTEEPSSEDDSEEETEA
jgi:N utilization substance protein A